jgi:hypothetical protein
MTQLPPPAVDRRSGTDRRQTSLDAVAAGSVTSRRPSLPAPFTWSASLERLRPRDPWVSVVRRAIADYRDGSVEELARSWDDAAVWRVMADWPDTEAAGTQAIFEYHQALHNATAGTFEQEIVSLEASGGPIVIAHLRTSAVRNGRTLAMPSLLTFELQAMRVARVTEIPGDAAEWDGFWRD